MGVSVGVLDHFNIRTRRLAETVRFYEGMERQERRKVCEKIREDHLPAEGIAVSHEAADAWHRLRQLEHIDALLWKAGR